MGDKEHMWKPGLKLECIPLCAALYVLRYRRRIAASSVTPLRVAVPLLLCILTPDKQTHMTDVNTIAASSAARLPFPDTDSYTGSTEELQRKAGFVEENLHRQKRADSEHRDEQLQAYFCGSASFSQNLSLQIIQQSREQYMSNEKTLWPNLFQEEKSNWQKIDPFLKYIPVY